MNRIFTELHRRLKYLDMTDTEIAGRIGLSQSVFSHKMTGRSPWRETEMQKLLDEIGKPEETLADLFPRRRVT